MSALAFKTIAEVETDLVNLMTQATRLGEEGRAAPAAALLGHLAALRPDRSDVRLGLVGALGAEGRTLEALDQLAALAQMNAGTASLTEAIQAQSTPAIEKFNAHLAAGEIEAAERYVAAIARLTPNAPPVLQAAMGCNQSLGRVAEAARYAQALIGLDADNVAARTLLAEIAKAAGDVEREIENRLALALSAANDLAPLLRLRDLHDVAGVILCRPLNPRSKAQIDLILARAKALTVPSEPGSEWEAWGLHYRVLIEALDMPLALAPAAAAQPDPDARFVTTAGKVLTAKALRARADKLGVRAVFFAAADQAYIDLYARWYALSILRYCDVPFLIVIHVVGGADRLKDVAAKIGIDDERLVFTGDDFDAAAVTTRCYDSPPKGLIEKPVAHLQSARFQHLGPLLAGLEQPVFVSDIDLLLQRGVADLLERSAGADVVFNENENTLNAGSRLTANLLLINPTPNAGMFLGFLKAYLDDRLGRERVTRWIDQVALVLGRHNLQANAPDLKLGYFDTASDINNVMFPSYQDHPFRFLSLYHGFDTASLEDPRVLGGSA